MSIISKIFISIPKFSIFLQGISSFFSFEDPQTLSTLGVILSLAHTLSIPH